MKAKMKKSHPVPVRIDLDVKDAFEKVAKAEDRSLSYLINRVCRRAMDEGTIGVQPPARRGKS
jgi:hypothetical protein